MPIEFSCECGKAFKVADEYAGKRSKCTACGKPVVVPTPAPVPAPTVQESAEDAALRALTEGDDPVPASRTSGSYAGADDAPRRPAPPPPRSDDTGAHAARALAAFAPSRPSEPKAKKVKAARSSYDAPPSRGWSPNWAKVGTGALCLIGGLAWLGGGLLIGRIWWYSIFLILAGPFIMINGLLSRSE